MKNKEPGQDVWNRFWEQKRDLSRVYPSSPSVLHTLREELDLSGKKVLEVGAGSGRDSRELLKLGADVTVLDFAEGSLKLIQSHPGKNPELVRGDAFCSPFPTGCFHAVFHQGLLEHFLNPQDLLAENYRILEAGGYCLCDVPQTFHLYTLVKKLLIVMDKWFAGWETQFTMPQLCRLMEEAGFEVVYCYGDWMRPSFLYRVLRELAWKVGVDLPKYPNQDRSWNKKKDALLDKISTHPASFYTQLSIGVLGRKSS